MTTPGPVARAADLASSARHGPLTPEECALAVGALDDPDPRVRAAALGALVRGGSTAAARDAWARCVADGDAAVRRRAAELAPHLASPVPFEPVLTLLDDADVTVVEAAAWSLGERGHEAGAARDALMRHVVARLAHVAVAHADPMGREAAVAALGALGDPDGLPAILAATADRPAVRRRAVLALAPFEGPEVDAALERALADKDWQIRQAAEDLRDA